jgi:hypothetical protein
MKTVDAQKYEQLLRDGFCIFENVLDPEMLNDLQAATEQVLSAQTEDDRTRQRTTGSMMPVTSAPFFANIIAWPKALQALASLGYNSPTFSDGYIHQ